MLFCITLYNYGIANVFLFLYSHCSEFYDSCNNDNSFKQYSVNSNVIV